VELIIVDKWFEFDSHHLYEELQGYVATGHCPMIKVDHGKMGEWFGESEENCFIIYNLAGNKSIAIDHYHKYCELYQPKHLNMFL